MYRHQARATAVSARQTPPKPQAYIEFWNPEKRVLQLLAVDGSRRFWGTGDYMTARAHAEEQVEIVEVPA